MSKLHDTLSQQVRETCRACHNVCYVSADADGNAPPVPAEGYRCEGCDAAGYERYDFDKSLPRPEGAVAEPTPPTNPEQPTEPTEPTDGEARPSDEPKSAGEAAEGQVVEVSAPVVEAR
jgi:hypothetical protein